MTKVKNQGFDFYRIKTEWVREAENGDLEKTKTEELVLASSYTEAEKVAYEIIIQQRRADMGDYNIEIIKTKISEITFNEVFQTDCNTVCGLDCSYFTEPEDSGVGMYSVKVITYYIDEKTGRSKHDTDIIYVPATSNADATRRATNLMKNSTAEFVVRETKFDKAEAIYWPTNYYNHE